MIKVGVAGLGMMGGTHLDVYSHRDDVEIVAVADIDEGRRTGSSQASGNIEGQAQGKFDFRQVKQHSDVMELIADPQVELVDICLPTPLHAEYGKAALRSGKHVFIEKPLARNYADAQELTRLAANSPGMVMCGMCMRFWPGWTWLKQRVERGEYGKVRSATFRRVAEHPGGPFYSDAEQCGGALLDLHIHDTDFIHFLFGLPEAVTSHGLSHVTKGIDHVVTRYEYPGIPIVMAEGSWSMAKGFGFRMQYTVNFERATATYDLAEAEPLTLFEYGRAPMKISLESGMGYQHEIAYFLDCIAAGRMPERVTLKQAAESIRIIEAEAESIRQQQMIRLSPTNSTSHEWEDADGASTRSSIVSPKG
jgi:predicted dehydrogenase